MRLFIFILLLIFTSCTQKVEVNGSDTELLNTVFLDDYHDYINSGYVRVPVDIILVEKPLKDVKIQIEFKDDLKSIRSKTWVFQIDNSLSIEENLSKLISNNDVDLVSPLCSIDSGYYFFNVVTKSNILLQGKVLNDGYSNSIELIFFCPDSLQ
jgi:hypothetical protein